LIKVRLMNKLTKKVLPISCLCSIYINTDLKDFALALDSLLIQDYIPNEIIIIIDGVINNDLKKFINYLEVNKIFKIYNLNKNTGLGNALRIGLEKCNNEFVARFDTDDINLKDRLKIQYDILKLRPDISIIGSSIIEYKSIECVGEYGLKKVPQDNNDIIKYSIFRNPINHPSVIFRKSKIINIGSYQDIRYFEDYDLWLRCIKNQLILNNLETPLVAMQREKYLSKRKGMKYAFYEFNFLRKSIMNRTLLKRSIPFYIIRIIIRLIPDNFISIIQCLDNKRNLIKFNLEEYIINIKNNPFSYSSKLNKY
tara:strand:- start:167 stop:1099 length:933 start_codon:yes stop_codon:yes gene_type:complete